MLGHTIITLTRQADEMKQALEDVPKLGLKGSSRLHKVPYGSLFNKFHGKKTKPHGTPQW